MNAEWIAVDWGTTNLRVWIVSQAGDVIESLTSDKGMGALQPADYEATLLELIDSHLRVGVTLPVICCGMAGARQGWVEAPYAETPCKPPNAQQAAKPNVADVRIAVRILPGVGQVNPPDVMRGEETQIAGYLSNDPDFDGIICLPGTHTKWVHVSAGEIVSFRTFMTGELFALLANQSVLRHGVQSTGWDDAKFAEGVDQAFSHPQSLSANLFSVRASGLLNDFPSASARARLSGLLIGSELAGAKPYWLGQRIVLLGTPGLSHLYQTALSSLGAIAEIGDAMNVTFDGLRAAYKSWSANP